ncbi:MAG: transcriptional regulator [Actinobacteria bacterium]|nr:transcriptional regulator [Actinomycetota bacterium]
MTYRSDPAFLVLHAVRLKGAADSDALARATGIDPVDVERVLGALAEQGRVEHRHTAPVGWRLLPEGAAVHATWLADELEVSGARKAVEEAHRRFLELNPELLSACTAWQRRLVEGAPVANDHTDAAYDQQVVARLVAVHHRITPVLDELADHLARFGSYAQRLQDALDHVRAGAGDWFTRPLIDSYHSVWFELHQDLLDTLAIDRATERVDA